MSAGWWPIESAPRDGTVIDLWMQSQNPLFAGRKTDCAWYRGGWWAVGPLREPVETNYRPREHRGEPLEWPPNKDDGGRRATHWRSIPSGPETA